MKVDELINEMQELIAEAKSLPLSGGKVIIEPERFYDILEEMKDSLPGEVRQAKNIVADRSNIIAEARRNAESIIREAEDRKKKMINQSEIVRQANAEAVEIVNKAKGKSSEIRKATNEYVEGIMKRTDDAITAQLTELRKTRQNLKITQKNNG